MNVSSSGPFKKASIFFGLIEYELNSLLGACWLLLFFTYWNNVNTTEVLEVVDVRTVAVDDLGLLRCIFLFNSYFCKRMSRILGPWDV